MSSGIKPGTQSKPGQGGLPAAVAPSSQAILLDKLNRQSTPDSEALASSDDEGDSHRQDPPPPSAPPQKPVRRASWLNDTSQVSAVRPRKESFASSTMSPTTSHPSTPSADSGVGTWGSHSTNPAVLNRAHTASTSFPWGVQIWTNKREEPPSRLSEVVPSPTTTLPPSSATTSFFNDLPIQTSPAPRDQQGPNSQIPFAIPLHPTPKTYRSQSYSVGQLEPDAATGALGSSAILGGRGRPMASGLQHRPSRPSMLSEMSSDGGMLGKVKEVEDDDDTSTNESLQGSQQQQAADARTIEYLARENAYLRQHAQPQFHAARIRPRASTAAAYGIGNGYGLHESVPEESDYAVDELDESNDAGELATKRAMSRRMTEYGGTGLFRAPFAAENRKIENVKKAYWQSAPYGAGGDMSQSRRHSFADVPIPTRQASIGSIGEAVLAHEQASQDSQQSQDFASPYSETHNFPGNAAQSYFGGPPHMPGGQAGLLSSAYANPYPSPYAMHSAFANRPTSPHRGMYGMTQPNRSTPLHIVLFKCARADVFYIQEGTGLTVKPGDLVIVEADRGTDLGTVAVDNVDWAEAKRLKEHYAEEQYKWLMMYSQNAGVAQEGVGAGLMAASNGLQGSAVGGMGPPGQHHGQEPNAGELKPKLIKRLAQSHEIHALRDKEGNEAKAKRVCMQKVKEHGLNMEILDAEFQMDWKKLTFYYFADSYINFNSLVTDLFKIYKTRIWMSAINPASFASQPLGLQAPSGIGPGAVGVGRGAPPTTERRPNQQPEQPAASFSAARPTSRGFQAAGMGQQQPFGVERPGAPAGYPPPTFGYGGPYGAFGNVNVPRAAGVSFGPGGMPSADAYPPTAFPQASDYPGGLSRLPPGQVGSRPPHEQSMSPLSAPGDWVGTFQSLSLNTR